MTTRPTTTTTVPPPDERTPKRLSRVLGHDEPGAGAAVLTLGFEDRRRSRLRARLDDGGEVGLMLPRGTVLRDGDRLGGEPTGGESADTIVVVRAAPETLSVARTTDAHLLARAAYHLGNRHVPLQLAPGCLAYQHDHVLDGLVRALGVEVTTEVAPFEPEAGGYPHEGTRAGGHTHGHRHAHDQDHDDGEHAHGHPRQEPAHDHHQRGHDHGHDH